MSINDNNRAGALTHGCQCKSKLSCGRQTFSPVPCTTKPIPKLSETCVKRKGMASLTGGLRRLMRQCCAVSSLYSPILKCIEFGGDDDVALSVSN